MKLIVRQVDIANTKDEIKQTKKEIEYASRQIKDATNSIECNLAELDNLHGAISECKSENVESKKDITQFQESLADDTVRLAELTKSLSVMTGETQPYIKPSDKTRPNNETDLARFTT